MINKTDLAAAVGADLAVMERDALRMRDGGPFVFAQVGCSYHHMRSLLFLHCKHVVSLVFGILMLGNA